MDVRRADALLDLATSRSLGDIPAPQLPDDDTDNSEGNQRTADGTGVSGGGTDGCGYEPSTSSATAAGSGGTGHTRSRKPGVDLRVVVGAGTTKTTPSRFRMGAPARKIFSAWAASTTG
ncbi:hypothetical protein GCM10009765_05430 [Fodinicola feengrottensis]|uniref:Uncharacterized protein n=1 Tax=Fodinicola feengrottensis TaxID=435914 RepID=A0ABN2FTT4_9ACTN